MRLPIASRVLTIMCVIMFGLISSRSAAVTETSALLLSLEGAVSTALRQSSRALQAQLELEKNLVEALELEHQHERGAPAPTCIAGMCFGGVSDYEAAQIEELLPQQVAAIRTAVQASYLQEMASLQVDTIKAYYDALLAQGVVDIRKAHKERLRQQLEDAHLALQQGTVAQLDVAQLEAGLAQAEAELFSAAQQAELSILAMKEFLGLPLDIPVRLISEVGSWQPIQRDLSKDIEAAVEVSAEVAYAKGQVEVARKDLELFHEHAGGFRGRKTYRQRELALQEAELMLTDAQRRTETRVRGLHSQLAQLEVRLNALERQVALAEQMVKVAKLRYDAGLATITEVMEAETVLLEAQLTRLQALIDAHVAEGQLKVLLGQTPDSVKDRLKEIMDDVNALL